MKLTEWYPADIKPVHIGAYRVQSMYKDSEEIFYSYWNGKFWSAISFSIRSAYSEECRSMASYQNKVWRGIAK